MQRLLLPFGLLASLLYVVIDVYRALSYPHYDYAGQAISEMSAVGAPTTTLLAPLYAAFAVLSAGFGIGVWLTAEPRGWLHCSAAFMLAISVLGIGWALFPMNMRGVARSGTDTMHLVLGGLTMLLLTGTIASASMALGCTFRFYSFSTVFIMPGFFGLTMLNVPQVAANLPTPLMGLTERISMAAWLVWTAVLSVRLLSHPRNSTQQGEQS